MNASSYRWVIVAAGGLLGCLAIGAMFSLPVFILPISQDTGWSRTGISSAMTIGFIAMAFGSMGWGALSARLSAHLRPGGRRRRRRDLRADDGLRDRLVRY
jgi:MFS family permease